MQGSAAQPGTARHSAVQCSKAQHNIIWLSNLVDPSTLRTSCQSLLYFFVPWWPSSARSTTPFFKHLGYHKGKERKRKGTKRKGKTSFTARVTLQLMAPSLLTLRITVMCVTIYMKKLLGSGWLKAVQFKCNTSAKSVTPVQITHRNSGLWLAERQWEIF